MEKPVEETSRVARQQQVMISLPPKLVEAAARVARDEERSRAQILRRMLLIGAGAVLGEEAIETLV